MPISTRSSSSADVAAQGVSAPGADERVYPPQKIAILVDALAEEGIPAWRALARVGLSERQVAEPATRVSLTQVMMCLRNTVALSADPMFAYRSGLRFHMSAYGMYGFAMLSSTDFRETMRFAEQYHRLAAPLVDQAFSEAEGCGAWTLTPKAHPLMDRSLYRHVVEMYFGLQTSLHRDVMGSEFAPLELRVTFPCPCDPADYVRAFGVPVRFGQPSNQLLFAAAWLDRRPDLGNPLTYAAVLETCDRFVDELQQQSGVVGSVRHRLLTGLMRKLSLQDVARDLGLSVRTLRRRLADKGTSYRQIADELRREVAIKYLRDTDMTVEDVADALGFSDPANFRQAFRRWTSATPQQYRKARVALPQPVRPSSGWPHLKTVVAETTLGRDRPQRPPGGSGDLVG